GFGFGLQDLNLNLNLNLLFFAFLLPSVLMASCHSHLWHLAIVLQRHVCRPLSACWISQYSQLGSAQRLFALGKVARLCLSRTSRGWVQHVFQNVRDWAPLRVATICYWQTEGNRVARGWHLL